ncbi:hypothetical protein OIU76_017552 [Salix suchowensis]|nr:hypothetical protein OIU76_017552 [Salix suchowensis]KAJ6341440.1 hypothetical protein OIU78_009584 [Salix suchowensis]
MKNICHPLLGFRSTMHGMLPTKRKMTEDKEKKKVVLVIIPKTKCKSWLFHGKETCQCHVMVVIKLKDSNTVCPATRWQTQLFFP